MLKAVAAKTAALAQAARSFSPEASSTKKPFMSLGTYAFCALCVHAGLLALGLLGGLPTLADSVDTTNKRELLLVGLICGAAFAAVWVAFILYIFDRTSWVCWVLADFVLCGLLGFMLSGVYIVREANLDLPQSAAEVYDQTIIQRTCTIKCRKNCGRRCTRLSSYAYTDDVACDVFRRNELMEEQKRQDYICANEAHWEYNLTVTHWQAQKPSYSFDVDGERFDQTLTGSHVQIPVHSGALGLEWVDTDTIDPM